MNIEKLKMLRKLIIISAAIILMVLASLTFISGLRDIEPIVQGPGNIEKKRLSDWFEPLKGTAGDTDVYIINGDQKGGSALVFGGTHANEISGVLTSVLMIENAVVEKGKLFIIPHANNSAFTVTQPGEGYPTRYNIKTDWGERWFRFGSRQSNPIHQWPDPDCYTHFPTDQLLSGMDMRNLNRCFPGKPDGVLTEKVCYGITELIRKEKIDVTFDLHEAEPMFPIINTVVAHQRAIDVAIIATMNLTSYEDIQIGIELSAEKLRGYSHREIGDNTDTLVFLAETCNPIQDPFRGRTDEALLLTGKDDFLLKASELGILYVPFDENGSPIDERVGRQSSTVQEIITVFSEFYPEKEIILKDVPRLTELKEKGLGHYLRKPE